ncbi:MAG TPA: alpha/beta fold hydrolase [Acidimicrobiales bacterium]
MRFVLIHGGHHGVWCWDKLIPELEALGHTALAIDLPGCNERTDEPATHATWRAAFREVVEEGDVLVGHSMGGFAISLGADEVPDRVARLVYLSAATPIEGQAMGAATSETTVNDWPEVVGMPYDEFIEMVELPGLGPCVRMTKKEAADKLFYHDCSPEDQAWAWEHLTPLPIAPALETFHLPNFWSAPIPRDFVITTDDYSHPIEMDNVFMERIGLTTAFAIQSSHSPFISRPAETARVLHAAAGGALA